MSAASGKVVRPLSHISCERRRLRSSPRDGIQAQRRLERVGITVNRNAVPFDPRPPNYLLARLRELIPEQYPLAFGTRCMHDFVLSGSPLRKATTVRTLDVAKPLLDHGFRPPTVYFPLLVEEALLIEPTETETKETLDALAEALAVIVREAAEDPTIAQNAPYSTPVRRLDEAGAAKRPVIRQRSRRA